MKIIKEALEHDAMREFLSGIPPYFCEGKMDNDEPQNFEKAVSSELIPYWKIYHDSAIGNKVIGALNDILDGGDINKALYIFYSFAFFYYYNISILCKKNDFDFPEIDFSSMGGEVKQLMNANRVALECDTRWAGEKWNSRNGLWGPLMDTATHIRDKYNGPNLIP